MFLDRSVMSVETMVSGGLCRVCYYFLCMLIGLLLSRRSDGMRDLVKIKEDCYEPGKQKIIVLILTAIFSYGVGMGYRILTSNFELQFLVQAFTLLAVVLLFVGLRESEPYLKKLPFHRMIHTLADYSWEIYLTQTLIIPLVENIVFPVNLLLILTLIAISSFVLKNLVRLIFARIHF